MRALVLERDRRTCCMCGREGDTVDHDPPIEEMLAQGMDPYDMGHLRTMCRRCHGERDGGRSPTRWQAAPRPKVPNPFDCWMDR